MPLNVAHEILSGLYPSSGTGAKTYYLLAKAFLLVAEPCSFFEDLKVAEFGSFFVDFNEAEFGSLFILHAIGDIYLLFNVFL